MKKHVGFTMVHRFKLYDWLKKIGQQGIIERRLTIDTIVKLAGTELEIPLTYSIVKKCLTAMEVNPYIERGGGTKTPALNAVRHRVQETIDRLDKLENRIKELEQTLDFLTQPQKDTSPEIA